MKPKRHGDERLVHVRRYLNDLCATCPSNLRIRGRCRTIPRFPIRLRRWVIRRRDNDGLDPWRLHYPNCLLEFLQFFQQGYFLPEKFNFLFKHFDLLHKASFRFYPPARPSPVAMAEHSRTGVSPHWKRATYQRVRKSPGRISLSRYGREAPRPHTSSICPERTL